MRDEIQSALDRVLELAHVARPAVARSAAASASGAKPVDRLAGGVAQRRRRKCSASSGMSSGRSRSGGIVDRDDVEPVVEVLAEAPLRDFRSSRSRLRRRDDAHVDARASALPPTRRTRRSCRTRSSFDLHRRRHVADLVEEQRAAVAPAEQALRVARPRR